MVPLQPGLTSTPTPSSQVVIDDRQVVVAAFMAITEEEFLSVVGGVQENSPVLVDMDKLEVGDHFGTVDLFVLGADLEDGWEVVGQPDHVSTEIKRS